MRHDIWDDDYGVDLTALGEQDARLTAQLAQRDAEEHAHWAQQETAVAAPKKRGRKAKEPEFGAEFFKKPKKPRNAEATRVSINLWNACIAFAQAHTNQEYTNGDLWIWVQKYTGKSCAPDSPRREMQFNFDAGIVGHDCKDHGAGVHKILWVK